MTGPIPDAGPGYRWEAFMSTIFSFTRLGTATGLALAFAAGTAFAESKPPVVISAAGNIIPALEQFRALQGDNLGNKPAARNGRREINWDGVPDDKAAPAFLPPDFFKGRGVILKT